MFKRYLLLIGITGLVTITTPVWAASAKKIKVLPSEVYEVVRSNGKTLACNLSGVPGTLKKKGKSLYFKDMRPEYLKNITKLSKKKKTKTSCETGCSSTRIQRDYYSM